MYMEAYNSAFPLKYSNIPKKYMKISPWIANGIVKASITKSKLLTAKLQQPTDKNIEQYTKYYKMYNEVFRMAKATYYSEQLEAAKFNMKETWTLLKPAMNKSTTENALPKYCIIEFISFLSCTLLLSNAVAGTPIYHHPA